MVDDNFSARWRRSSSSIKKLVDTLIGNPSESVDSIIKQLHNLKSLITKATSKEEISRLLSQYKDLSMGMDLAADLDPMIVSAMAEQKIGDIEMLARIAADLSLSSEEKSQKIVDHVVDSTLRMIAKLDEQREKLEKDNEECLARVDSFIQDFIKHPEQITAEKLAKMKPDLEKAIKIRKNMIVFDDQSLKQIEHAAKFVRENAHDPRYVVQCQEKLEPQRSEIEQRRQNHLETLDRTEALFYQISAPQRAAVSQKSSVERTQVNVERAQVSVEIAQLNKEQVALSKDAEIEKRKQKIAQRMKESRDNTSPATPPPTPASSKKSDVDHRR